MQDVVTLLTEFGAAGLIGVLWLLERRAASHREKQIDEAHQRIIQSGEQMAMLLEVINRNTRAIEQLETSQRRMHILLERRDQPTTASQREDDIAAR